MARVYPKSTIIRDRNGKAIGEVYSDKDIKGCWGYFCYASDTGGDGIDSYIDAIHLLLDEHQDNT